MREYNNYSEPDDFPWFPPKEPKSDDDKDESDDEEDSDEEEEFDAEDAPDRWRYFPPRPIVQLFKEWEQNFVSLKWVAKGTNHETVVDDDFGGDQIEVSGFFNLRPTAQELIGEQAFRQIYRQNGWPGNFDREKCIADFEAFDVE